MIAGQAKVLIGTGLLVAGCLCGPWSRDEVARVRSPDGAIEGVIVETNGGATTSFGYEIHVVSAGGRPEAAHRVAFLYGAGRNASAYGVNLRWTSPASLSIEYCAAKSANLDKPSVSIGGRQVSITLSGGIEDALAPPGGMLYNLRGPARN
jgi:hypothetical protein